MTINAATIKTIRSSNSPSAWTDRPTAEVASRAEDLLVIIRDTFLNKATPRPSTVRHFAGLIRTLEDRGEDTNRLQCWLAAFRNSV